MVAGGDAVEDVAEVGPGDGDTSGAEVGTAQGVGHRRPVEAHADRQPAGGAAGDDVDVRGMEPQADAPRSGSLEVLAVVGPRPGDGDLVTGARGAAVRVVDGGALGAVPLAVTEPAAVAAQSVNSGARSCIRPFDALICSAIGGRVVVCVGPIAIWGY